MLRIRLGVLALGVLLLIGELALGRRALESEAEEEQLRHEILAARVFDELERQLTELLEAEEARPFLQYRFFYVPEGQVELTGDADALALSRSPLATPSERSFVLGYFQIDPDGAFYTPLRPRDTEWALANALWSPEPESEALDTRLRLLAGDLEGWGSADPVVAVAAPVEPGAATSRVDRRQTSAGSRSGGQPANTGGVVEKRASAKTVVSSGKAVLTELLDGRAAVENSLNTGATSRANRSARVEKSRTRNVDSFQTKQLALPQQEPSRSVEGRLDVIEALDGAAPDTEPPDAESQDAASDAALPNVDAPGTATPDVTPSGADAPAPAAPGRPSPADPIEAPAADVDVELSPLQGRPLDDAHLALYRTVRISGATHLQGLVLRRAELNAWLESQLTPEVEAVMDLEWGGDASSPQPPGVAYRFDHAFAEPFTALNVTAWLRPLEGGDASGWIRQLTSLLAVFTLVGLLALYKTVAVAVQFAERRNNFVAAVSHELKTPLTSIRMYSEMLREGMVASEEKRLLYYETITAESERLSRLIENVLELSRLEKGRRSMSVVVGSPAEALEEVLRVLRPHARDQGFSLELEVEPSLPAARFDPDALIQVLINLVDNALKFSADAEEKRIVILCSGAPGGVEIRVRDRGPGVPPRQLKQIFQPFYRGERELTRRTRGTGIGLSLVRGLVERMGGEVSARNHPAGGFEVRILLKSEGS